jgi:hypothetical protein
MFDFLKRKRKRATQVFTTNTLADACGLSLFNTRSMLKRAEKVGMVVETSRKRVLNGNVTPPIVETVMFWQMTGNYVFDDMVAWVQEHKAQHNGRYF